MWGGGPPPHLRESHGRPAWGEGLPLQHGVVHNCAVAAAERGGGGGTLQVAEVCGGWEGGRRGEVR